MQWNFGDIIDSIVPILPEGHLALVHGDREITWNEMSARTNNLARNLLANGAETGDKVVLYAQPPRI